MTDSTLGDSFYALETEWRGQLGQWATGCLLEAAALEALNLRSRPSSLEELIAQWAKGDFSGLPPIELLSASDIPGAAGAYAASTGTIYLNQDWLAGANSAQAFAALTEELGHHLDVLLNAADTPGDEGELFARLLSGQVLTDAEKEGLRTGNDVGGIFVQGGQANVEVAITSDQPTWIKQYGTVDYEVSQGTAVAADGKIWTAMSGRYLIDGAGKSSGSPCFGQADASVLVAGNIDALKI